jgi:dTDP-4-dehydrorhamnose reductase
MTYKTLVLGNGFIGSKVGADMACDVCDRRIASITDAQAVVDQYKPDIIVNCIGHTGPRNVDDCETDKDKTLIANSFVPVILAETALRNSIKLVHVSSGCIYHFDYSKQKPVTEEEVPDFFDLFYSRTKIYAERALEAMAQENSMLIVRIRIPLDNRPHPKNLLTKLIKYGTIIDIPNSVTYVPDFLKALKHLIKIDARGIYNVVNKFGLRYPDLMDTYKKYAPDFKYTIIDPGTLKLVRTNLVMSVKKLEKTGFAVRPIKDVLEECVKEYVK